MLRQQLTTMLGDLYTDHAVPKAISDLNAILTVNSEKLSSQQKEKLTEARNKMLEMRKILEKMHEPGYDPLDAANADSHNNYHTLFLDSKKLIGETAATF